MELVVVVRYRGEARRAMVYDPKRSGEETEDGVRERESEGERRFLFCYL